MFRKLVPFLLLGGVAAAFLLTAKKLKKLDTAVTRLQYKSLSLTTIRFELDLAVTNPGQQSVNIQEIELALVYRGDTMASMKKTGINIPVGAEKTIKITNITADVSTLSALSQILSAFLGDTAKTMTVSGTIKADGFSYPVNETINIS